jgi:hypothetical protein
MKRVLLVCLLLAMGFSVYGGNGDQKTVLSDQAIQSFVDKLFFGGNLGLNFSNNFTLINISPNIGYMATEKLGIGVGVIYQYRNDGRFNPEIKTNDYGFNTFARYQIFRPVFAQIEYEYLNFEFVESVVNNEVNTSREGYNSFFLGGGLAQPIGRNASFFLSVLYNILYDDNEVPRPYGSPLVIRAGVSAGF